MLHPGYKYFKEKILPLNEGKCPQDDGVDIIFSLEYRQWLYDRINLRVEKMFENGVEKELKKLIAM